jgi:hypothetical protein
VPPAFKGHSWIFGYNGQVYYTDGFLCDRIYESGTIYFPSKDNQGPSGYWHQESGAGQPCYGGYVVNDKQAVGTQ